MSNKKTDFLQLIKKQRATKKEEKFEGTFIEYLDLVSKDSSIAMFAHKRLCDVIETHGVNTIAEDDPRKNKIFNGDNIKIYEYFAPEFYGMERVISKIMRFLKSASLKGEELNMQLGFSHDIKYKIPKNIKLTVEKSTIIKINGIDKDLVGKTAAEIKKLRPVEPYKGKGIKERGQYVLRKEGKKK